MIARYEMRDSMLRTALQSQRELDGASRERAHEERIAYLERFRADITPEEAAQELADLEDERWMLDQEQPD